MARKVLLYNVTLTAGIEKTWEVPVGKYQTIAFQSRAGSFRLALNQGETTTGPYFTVIKAAFDSGVEMQDLKVDTFYFLSAIDEVAEIALLEI